MPPAPLRLVKSSQTSTVTEPELADYARLVDGLRAHHAWAQRQWLQMFTSQVRRLLARILGTGPDLEDLTQEVFIRAIDHLDDLRDPHMMGPWLTQFAINVARESLRKRARWRWLQLLPTDSLPEPELSGTDEVEASAVARATYEVLDHLSVDSRMALALRHLQDMELTEVADACGVSLATIKRRLDSAEQMFMKRAKTHPVLREWMERETPWGRP